MAQKFNFRFPDVPEPVPVLGNTAAYNYPVRECPYCNEHPFAESAGFVDCLPEPDGAPPIGRWFYSCRRDGCKSGLVPCHENNVRLIGRFWMQNWLEFIRPYPKVCVNKSGLVLRQKRPTPVGRGSSGAQSPQNPTTMRSIAFDILRHPCIQNARVQPDIIFMTRY